MGSVGAGSVVLVVFPSSKSWASHREAGRSSRRRPPDAMVGRAEARGRILAPVTSGAALLTGALVPNQPPGLDAVSHATRLRPTLPRSASFAPLSPRLDTLAEARG